MNENKDLNSRERLILGKPGVGRKIYTKDWIEQTNAERKARGLPPVNVLIIDAEKEYQKLMR